MVALVLKRRIAAVVGLLGLCSIVAGCVSEMSAPTADASGGNQLRYYGGPKSPMWSSQ
jgi:hypothetical protein